MLLDFQCQQCQFVFEELINKEEDNPVCIKCNGLTDRLLPLTGPTLFPATEAYNRAMDVSPSTRAIKNG